jgi:hypothetical protein
VILYKYVPPERIDILESGLVAFSAPAAFNDPFEAKLIFPPMAPETPKLEGGLAYAHYMRDTILRLTLEHAPNVIGVLSLSEKRDNLLMWAHYAAQHTGFVIGFDSENPALVAQQKRIGRPHDPEKIAYSSERPARGQMVDITLHDLYFLKSEEWEYEAEWRYTRLLRNATKTLEMDGKKVSLFEFPKEAVAEVILGCRASDVLTGEIMQLLAYGGYTNAKLLSAELDPTRFHLNIVPTPGFGR